MDLKQNNQSIELHKGTISISLVNEVISAVKDAHCDMHAILHQSGIPLELLDAPKARISIESFGR